MPRPRNQTPPQALVSPRKLKRRRRRLRSVAFVTQHSSLHCLRLTTRSAITQLPVRRNPYNRRRGLLDLGRGRFRLWVRELQLVGHSDQLGQRPLILRIYTGRQGEKPTAKRACIPPSGSRQPITSFNTPP